MHIICIRLVLVQLAVANPVGGGGGGLGPPLEMLKV